jgi:hypothetical protein
MINSTFNPMSEYELSKDKLNFAGKSASGILSVEEVNGSIVANELAIDITLADDHLLFGGSLAVKGGKFGDKVSLQVVHPQVGVLNEYITDYGIVEDQQKQFDIVNKYPAKIPAGLILRVKYIPCTEPGIRSITVFYPLHKVLI